MTPDAQFSAQSGDNREKLGVPGWRALSVQFSSCHNASKMTNRIAVYIGVAVLLFLVLDYALGLGLALYLARRFLDLIGLIAVWR